MAQWTPLKRDVLDSLADEFLHNYGKGRTLLAVDGDPAAGTRRFADDLAVRLGRGSHAVFRASLDDFRLPRATWDDTPEGRYRHRYDYAQFRRVLIEPFTLGGSTGFVTAAFDAARDQPFEMDWKTGPQDATLVIDGPYLNRPELRGMWNWSLWVDGPGSTVVSKPYGAERPRTRSSAIVDNSDPEHPRRVFADSC
jgi:uridine kinase